MTDSANLSYLTADLTDAEALLADAVAEGDTKSIKAMKTEIADLTHAIKIATGETEIDSPAPKGGSPVNEGIHSAKPDLFGYSSNL